MENPPCCPTSVLSYLYTATLQHAGLLHHQLKNPSCCPPLLSESHPEAVLPLFCWYPEALQDSAAILHHQLGTPPCCHAAVLVARLQSSKTEAVAASRHDATMGTPLTSDRVGKL